MAKYIEKAEKTTLSVIPLKGIVVFPGIPQSVEFSDKTAKKICYLSKELNESVFLISQKDITQKNPDKAEDFVKVGTVAKIKDTLRLPNGNIRVIFDGYCRASLLSTNIKDGIIKADILCKYIACTIDDSIKEEALIREALTAFDKMTQYLPKLSEDIALNARKIKNPATFSDYIASNLFTMFENKQEILDEFDPIKRIERLIVIMEKEARIFEAELSIHKKVVSNIESRQRENYLREQMRVIQEELGDDSDNEIEEYADAIYKKKMPDEVSKKLLKEVGKLHKMPYTSIESGLIRSYLDTCLELPWSKRTKDRVDIRQAMKILDRDHDGLEEVKERIIEYLAVKQLNPELKNQIICLYGPPGTGKTSVARSIADAMNRKYVRVALGGIRDEADIRGHRRTYVGSMPGRIMTAITKAGVKNPLVLLDEVDKLTKDSHGDPSSALLEVLDSEQNKNFRDHYIEMPFDLSECMFIATANTLDTIPRPLLDRMEVIELQIYTRTEKIMIAKNHLIPKQLKRHGLTKKRLKLDDSAVGEIIDYYTHEAGVRNLEREIASLCRKCAKRIIEGELASCIIKADNVSEYIGGRKILPDNISEQDEVGVVNGLAYTQLGGDLLKIEALSMPGTGKIELTGSLGDVMKESARAAISYIRSRAEDFGIDKNFYKNRDIHIHVPEGAIPKDGPSAGVTITTALVSELTGRSVKKDIAMTGEISLRGRVLAIGGLREKTMAAYKAGVKNVLIPADNKKDLDKIDLLAKENLNFIFCSTLDDVLKNAFTDKPYAKEVKPKSQKQGIKKTRYESSRLSV